MNILKIIIILLHLPLVCFAENKQEGFDKPDNRNSPMDASVNIEGHGSTALDRWTNDFYESLLNNKSTELQAIAINMLDEDLSIELESLLSSNRLNVKTYFILADTCTLNDTYKTLCSDHEFFKRFKNIDPNNIITLMNGLAIAIESNDNEGIKKTIAIMSKQKKAQIYYGNSIKKIKQAMINYNQTHAIPINYKILSQTTSLKQILDNHNILEMFNENKVEITLNFQVFTTTLLGVPPYGSIIKSCKNMELFDECNLISEVFVNSSDALITKHIGYTIKRITNNLKRDFDNFKQANINLIKLQKYTECIQNINDKEFYIYMYLQPIHMDTFIENIEKFGEIKTYQKAAKSLHTYLIDKGIESTYSIKDCNEIQDLTNQGFYQSYGEDDAFISRMEEFDQPVE